MQLLAASNTSKFLLQGTKKVESIDCFQEINALKHLKNYWKI